VSEPTSSGQTPVEVVAEAIAGRRSPKCATSVLETQAAAIEAGRGIAQNAMT